MTAADWPIRRAMLLAGGVAVGCAVLSMTLPPWSLFALAAAVLLTLLLPWCRRPAWAFAACVAALLLCSGGMYRLWVVAPCEALVGEQEVVTAVVQEVPTGSMAVAEIVTAEKAPVGTRVLLYCPQQAMPTRYETVRGEIVYQALSAAQGRYQADGIFLQAYPTAYEEDAFVISPPTRSFATVMERLRQRLLEEIYACLPGEDGALLAGLCLGDQRGISDATSTAFRRAGLPHLLVVSGLHLSVIGGGAYALLRLLLRRRRWAAVGAMAVVLGFSALVGFSPSVVRAGVACFVLLSGRMTVRRADGLNSLGLALTLLVAGTPYCLLDAGLLLSFGATAGILCLYTPLCHVLRRLPSWLASGLAVTLAASLPIGPLLAYLFGELSVVSPVANLLTVGPSGVSLTLGCLALMASLLSPLAPVAEGLFFLAAWPLRWTRWVSALLGELSLAVLSIDRAWVLVYLTGACGLSILCIYRRHRELVRLLAVGMGSLLLLAMGLSRVAVADAVAVTVSVRDSRPLLYVESGERRGVLVLQAADLYADARLRRACETGVDFLVIGDGTAVDTARLTDFLRQIPADTLLIGGDCRWLTGLSLPVAPLPLEATDLCDGVVLTATPSGWLLDCSGSTLALTSSGEYGPAGAAIVVGELPSVGEDGATEPAVYIGENEAAEFYVEAALTDGERYLTARAGGDWSVTQWR